MTARTITEADLEAMITDVWERYPDSPPHTVFVSEATILAFRKALSQFHRRQNRMREMRRRRAIGRGRW